MMKIVLTGGGTAGHVMPHLALLPLFEEKKWEVFYIGTSGIEKQIIQQQGMPFFTISAGKLRRYMSFKNLLDVFRLFLGICQAFGILLKIKPQMVFSKGGFVSVPVAVAAWVLGIPVVTHESDVTPGLANKILTPFSKRVLCAFPKTLSYLPASKSRLVGLPVREDLRFGSKKNGYLVCGFNPLDQRPVILIMGGSQGADKINQAIFALLDDLLPQYRLVHLTGKGKSKSLALDGYKSFEFVGEELKDLLAIADFAIARAGANSIFELLDLAIPMLLIPLEAGSRGDQIKNAEAFAESGYATVLRESLLSPKTLLYAVEHLIAQQSSIKSCQKSFKDEDTKLKIIRELETSLS